MVIWLAWAASAEPPEVPVHAAAGIADGQAERASWLGAHGGVEWPIGRFSLGGRALVGVLTPGRFGNGPVGATVQPVGRVWLTQPEVGGLSAVLGAGLRIEDGVAPVVSGGLAVDLGPRGRTRPRVEGSYHVMPDQWRLSLSAGVVLGRRPEDPVPVVEEPAPIPIDRGVAWVPAPVCDWLTPEELLQRGDLAPMSLLDERGLRPYAEVAGEQPRPTTEPSLVVAAWPGDEVLIDGVVAETDDGGLAVAHPPEGPVDVQIRGAGRLIERELAVAEEHALWFGVEPPPPVRIRFAVARATITAEERARILEVVENRGGWVFEVRGSHSPEGDPARNEQLARARADAVLAVLREAGLSDEQVYLSDIIDIVGLDAPPDELRAAVIYPREAR